MNKEYKEYKIFTDEEYFIPLTVHNKSTIDKRDVYINPDTGLALCKYTTLLNTRSYVEFTYGTFEEIKIEEVK